jgi:hypothetical protein
MLKVVMTKCMWMKSESRNFIHSQGMNNTWVDLSSRRDDNWVYWPGGSLASKHHLVILSPVKDLPNNLEIRNFLGVSRFFVNFQLVVMGSLAMNLPKKILSRTKNSQIPSQSGTQNVGGKKYFLH